MPPQTKLLTSKDGTEIYAEAAGEYSKPHVVFIHGLALSGIVFAKQFTDKKLLENLYMVRYDMRGHGQSGKPDHPEAYASNRVAEDFVAVVDGFSLNKPFLAGWSMGATIAVDLCTAYGPSCLSGLIYLAALPYIGKIQAKIGTQVIKGFVPGLLTIDDVALASKTTVAFVESVVVDLARLPYETKMAWIGCATLQSPSVRKCVLTREQDPTRLLQEGGKTLPLLLLHGANDTQIKGDALIEEMKSVFADFEGKLVSNAGHAVFWDKPDEVRDEVLRFVSRAAK